LSVGLGCGENKELLSLSPVQETDCASRQQSAIIAVAHSLLVIGYYLQTNCCVYQELGGNYFDRLHAEGLKPGSVSRCSHRPHRDYFRASRSLGSERLLPMKKPAEHPHRGSSTQTAPGSR
jgi:hypothetical protein